MKIRKKKNLNRYYNMGMFGKLGKLAARGVAKKIGLPKAAVREIGKIGEAAADTVPVPQFKTGGRVKRTGLAKVHKGEFVLPKEVKPTKAQKAKVAKLKAKK